MDVTHVVLREASPGVRITNECAEGFMPRIRLQGYAEAVHGFGAVLLSLMPLRAAGIVQSIIEIASVESRQEHRDT
ncbi:hypothetical protein ACFXJ6_34995 [Streptomyces sp. NPDC059218]|uniref:hypothetical protein n=1 Tax=unclassified Streptomyces TaxID=2593676 RepID=UPI00369E4F85